MADFSKVTEIFSAGKTPFHRLENQLAVILDTTGVAVGTRLQAGTYLRISTNDLGNYIIENPEDYKARVATGAGDIGYIQGILIHDIDVKERDEEITVAMAFGGVLYKKIMNLVNPASLSTDAVFITDTVNAAGIPTALRGSQKMKENFKLYGVRQEATNENNL